jgi:uncharacterized iron-regulated protein
MRTIQKIIVLSALLFLQCASEDEPMDVDDAITNPAPNTPVNGGSNTNSNSTSQEFDRSGMLAFWADNIILPAYTQLNTSLITLSETVAAFAENPSATTLSSLRNQWLATYSHWQYVEMFDIGLAEEIYFKNRMNLFPANVTRIENNINGESYDLDASSYFTSQGFSALDYLIFGTGESDDAIIALYADSDLNYGNYLDEVTDKMIDLTEQVKTQWEGDYRDTFVQSTDNTSTSGLNKMVNDFVFYYEKGFRANKIGIPAGIFSNNPLPDRIEAYHGEVYAKILALDASNAVYQFFNGIAYNDASTTGLSLKNYLDYIEADVDDKLSARINAKFQAAENKINDLNTNFKQQIQEDNNAMLLTYDAIQSNVVLIKVDMLQKLNVSVDYADADGD